VEIQDNLSLLDEPYSPFHVEFGMSSEFDFGPRDERPLCDTMDHILSLPTMGIQFSGKATARTDDVIDRSVTISTYEQIYDSTFRLAQHRNYDYEFLEM
jgi:hypothetical protein